jgi:hypothetical protein
MTVTQADPRAQSLDEAFAEAMGAAPRPKEPPAPPEVDRDAPHGRDEAGEPLAPYGKTKDGRPKLSPAGRKPGNPDDKARLAKDSPDAKGQGTQLQLEPQDFSAPLMEAGETIWFGGSVVAKLGPQIPVVGKFVPGRKLAATMAVFDGERPRLAAALNLAAQHDARARRLAERLATGDAGWALTCMFMVAPFTGAVAAIWQTTDKHDVLKERELPSLDELAKANEAALDRMFAKIAEQMAQAQAAAAGQGELGAAAAA